MLIVACAAIGGVGALSHNDWIMGGAILGIFVLAFPMLWRIINFAERNPHVAILDGAQFLKHEQLILASKNIPEIQVIAEAQAEAHPALLPSGTEVDANDQGDDPSCNSPKNTRGGS